jgi:tetratricopeptide (TPR) repeat protein
VALALNPSYAWAHSSYGGMLEDQGRAHEALDQLLLAEAADPLGTLQLLTLGFLFTWLGRWEEALDRIHHLGELEPSHPWYRFVLAHYYLAHGEREQGLAEMERWEELESDPRRKPIIRATRLALGGQPEEARALLRLEETLPAYDPTGPSARADATRPEVPPAAEEDEPGLGPRRHPERFRGGCP